jgi:uncharacterized protein (TIGR02145 family)
MRKLAILVLLLISFACTNRDGEIIDLINSVKKQNDDLKAQISALKKTTDSALVAVLKVNSLQTATDKKIDLIQTDLKSVLAQITSLTSQITSTTTDLGALKVKIDVLQAKCNELVAQISLLTGTNIIPIVSNPISSAVPTVTSKTGRIWMDRNLGATQVATSPTDEKSYGYYYQWGRGNDGHQFPTSLTTTIRSQSDQPGNALFILVPGPNNLDWKFTPNPNLWQGVNGSNNVCPTNFRLPTNQEWEQEITTWSNKTAEGAFLSVLKLPLNGTRVAEYGTFNETGFSGRYWASSFQNDLGGLMGLTINNASTGYIPRAYGQAVRCIKD